MWYCHKETINKIKNTLCSKQIRVPSRPYSPIQIQCDASQDAIGCCMLQSGHPVSFYSRFLQYAQIKKELLAFSFSCVNIIIIYMHI